MNISRPIVHGIVTLSKSQAKRASVFLQYAEIGVGASKILAIRHIL
jgi:hypothetical protein